MKTLLSQRRIMQLSVLLVAGPAGIASVATALEARYVRIDNPTGFVMEFRQVEVYSGGKNVVLGHPEMFCGTVPPLRENTAPTQENSVLSNSREAKEITSGDCEFKAWVASVQNVNTWSKAWVMSRETFNANALNAGILLTPGNRVTYQWRSATGGGCSYGNVGGLTAPYWVRVTSHSNPNLFTAVMDNVTATP